MSRANTENWPVLTIHGAPDPHLVAGIVGMVAVAAESDGNPPLSEQTLVNLRSPGANPDNLLTLAVFAPEETRQSASTADAGQGVPHPDVVGQDLTGLDLAGAAVVSLHPDGTGLLEIVVHPSYRNQGVGARLVETLRNGRGLQGINAWSHGNHEAAADIAKQYGYVPVRELWRMRLTKTSAALPGIQLPEGVRIRAFVPGRDEQAWLAANADAFAHHPEQGALTLGDLRARMSEPWFDPQGFLLAVDSQDRVLGFHWTKVHPRTGSHPAIGEVYVVGVTARAQGTGLGKALTIAGINHLRNAGLSAIMLYVDADNAPAVALYRKLGFTLWDSDIMYAPAEAVAPA